MGIFKDLIEQFRDKDKDTERIIRAFRDEGESLAREIAEKYEQIEEKRKKIVPQVDVSPVDMEKFQKKAREKQVEEQQK